MKHEKHKWQFDNFASKITIFNKVAYKRKPRNNVHASSKFEE